jgi:transcriptional regulator with XRE-family HTH domain
MSKNNSLPNIGKNIKKLRQVKGISQDRLSKLANLSLNTVVNIENGGSQNPTLETIQKVATALETTIDNIIKERDGRDRKK